VASREVNRKTRFEGFLILQDPRHPNVALARIWRPGGVCTTPSCGRRGTTFAVEVLGKAHEGDTPVMVMWADYCEAHESAARRHFALLCGVLPGAA
jgi:hypothetical protein